MDRLPSVSRLTGSLRRPDGVSSLVGVFSLVLCAACGGSSGAGTDGGTDSGSHHEAGGKTDSGGEASVPFSACGHPGDEGNSIGVGKYCTSYTDCPVTAPLCSNIENSPGSATNTFFCVIPCNSCPLPDCGEGASCVCEGPGLCGCTPNSCSAIIPDGGLKVCAAEAGADTGSPADSGAKD
jgi:hypothetical protein